jgi:hypothetical protein
MSDFQQRQIAMLDKAIQARREQAHRAWGELRDQISLDGDHRTVHLQTKLIALNIAVLAVGDLADQRDAIISGPKRLTVPQKIDIEPVQIKPLGRVEAEDKVVPFAKGVVS